MAQYRSVGGLFTLEPEQTVSWTTAIGGLDGGVVVQAPNIIDDVIGSDVLVTVNQEIGRNLDTAAERKIWGADFSPLSRAQSDSSRNRH
ncbi:hypothetical protein [Paraburkholderia sp. BR14374]|uniref:hypothetical protein n=1 Tax=Paraburkholderia sp. BR14374 TaxID=3237007 RepID=UPI0034CD9B89